MSPSNPFDTEEFNNIYRNILQNVNDAIAVYDPDTLEMVFVNQAHADILGYTRNELMEQGLEEITADELGYTMDKARSIIDQTMDSDQSDPGTFEWVCVDKSDEFVSFEVSPHTIQIDGRRFYTVIAHDITEEKRMEEQYEHIFDNVYDAIEIYDPETYELIDANEAYCDMLGYDIEELKELGIEGISATEKGYTGERAQKIIDETMSSDGSPEPVEWVNVDSEGDEVHVELLTTKVEVNGRERFIVIERDITEQKMIEEQYQNVFHSLQDAISIYDPETLELVDANETFCDILGYEFEELREMGINGFSKTTDGFDLGKAERIVQRNRTDSESDSFRWKCVDKNGQEIIFDVLGKITKIDGQQRYLSISRDVTERERIKNFMMKLNSITADTVKDSVQKIQDVIKLALEHFELSTGVVLNRSEGGRTVEYVVLNQDTDEFDSDTYIRTVEKNDSPSLLSDPGDINQPTAGVDDPPVTALISNELMVNDEIYGSLLLLDSRELIERSFSNTDRTKLERITLWLEAELDKKTYRERIEQMARYDSLTGLYNRGHFMKSFRNEFERTRRYNNDLSVVMIDLDHFSEINDSYGHQTGDRILEIMGEHIRESTRQSDFSGRYGGEEFCIALPETGKTRAKKLIKRIRQKLSETRIESDDDEPIEPTFSAGVASLVESIGSASQLIDWADTALYKAKHEGRDCTERRRHPRHEAQERRVTVQFEYQDYDAEVLNFSKEGLCLKTHSKLHQAERVTLPLKKTESEYRDEIEASICWRQFTSDEDQVIIGLKTNKTISEYFTAL